MPCSLGLVAFDKKSKKIDVRIQARIAVKIGPSIQSADCSAELGWPVRQSQINECANSAMNQDGKLLLAE
jgi:hypothetical protein